MAAHTTFAQRFVLKHKWPSLRGVALEARSVLAQQRDASAFEGLWKTGAATFEGRTCVWIMAVSATDFSFQDRVMMR